LGDCLGKYLGDELNCPEEMSGWKFQIPMQEYNSIHAAVMICATLVKTQAYIQTDRQLLTGYTV